MINNNTIRVRNFDQNEWAEYALTLTNNTYHFTSSTVDMELPVATRKMLGGSIQFNGETFHAAPGYNVFD